MKITVKAPATTANLGSGFDAAGIAFKLYNVISFESGAKLEFAGCDPRYANDKNLAYRAYKSIIDKLGENGGVKITFEEINVPLTRGLGSSAALIAAGAYAANKIYGSKLDKKEILKICTEIEGHPDNVAPAVYGGMTLALSAESGMYVKKQTVAGNLKFTALIPEFKVATKDARAALPKRVPMKDATYNLARAALLGEAFASGDPSLIAETTKDRLHEYYRKPLFKDANEIERIAYKSGAISCFVSGAGPTLIAVSTSSIAEEINENLVSNENGWKALELEVDDEGTRAI